MVVFRVCYKSGVRFDEGYYTSTHLPIAASVFGPHGLKRVEMMKVGPNPNGSAPPYQVIFSAYFETAAGLQAALASPGMKRVSDDVPNYYDGRPDVMTGALVDLPA